MTAIVLAAGESKRINLSLREEEKREYSLKIKEILGHDFALPEGNLFPKVIIPLGEKPIITHIIERVKEIGIERVVVVINPNFDIIREVIEKTFPEKGLLEFAYQREARGTGDAVLSCAHLLEGGDILVLCGDTPLLRSSTLSHLCLVHKREGADLTFLTAFLDEPKGYGRVWRDGNKISIVEEKDADAKQRESKEINAGVYLFKWPKVFPLLKTIRPSNKTGEYYLTDLVNLLSEKGGKVEVVTTRDATEILGVNDREEYIRVKALFTTRYRDR